MAVVDTKTGKVNREATRKFEKQLKERLEKRRKSKSSSSSSKRKKSSSSSKSKSKSSSSKDTFYLANKNKSNPALSSPSSSIRETLKKYAPKTKVLGKTLSEVVKETVKRKSKSSSSSSRRKKSSSSSNSSKNNLVPLPKNLDLELAKTQTTTPEIKALLEQRNKEIKKKQIKGVDMELRGLTKVQRLLNKENLVYRGGVPVVINSKGEFRALTPQERKDIEFKDTISLNPLNFGTGFIGFNKDVGTFLASPNKKEKIIKGVSNLDLNAMLNEAVKNPFGFAGEGYGAGKIVDVAFKGFKTSIKATKQLTQSEVSKLNTQINKLENKGVKANQRTLEAKELRNIKEQKKILEMDLQDLNKALQQVEVKPKTPKQLETKLKTIDEAGKNLKKRQSKRKKNLQDNKKLLEQLEAERKKQTSKPSKKDTFSLERVDKEFIKSLEEPKIKDLIKYNINNPQKLKKIKQILKNERNLNVKIIQEKGKVKIILKEGGKNLKKGVKTSSPNKNLIVIKDGKLTSVKRLDGKKGPKKKEIEKKTKKELKDEEFRKGQELEKQLKAEKEFLRSMEDLSPLPKKPSINSMFQSKKAQVNFTRTTKKVIKKQQNNISKLKIKEKQLGISYKKHIQKFKQLNGKATKKQIDAFKQNQAKLKESVRKIKQDIKVAKMELSRLQKYLSRASALSPKLASEIKSLNSFVSNLEKDLNLELKNIQDFKFPKGNPTPKPEGKGGNPTNTPKRLATPKKPTTTQIKKLLIQRQKKSPPPPPKEKPKKSKLGNKESSTSKRNLYEIQVRTGGKWKSKNIQLTYNRALKYGSDSIKNNLYQQTRLKLVGKTTNKDIKRPSLEGIDVKKSGSTTILKEKRRKALNTAREKAQLSNAKIKKSLSSTVKKKKKTTKTTKSSIKSKLKLKKTTKSTSKPSKIVKKPKKKIKKIVKSVKKNPKISQNKKKTTSKITKKIKKSSKK